MYKIPANTLFLGKNVIYVPECHSTNDLALQLTRQSSTIDGSVVITANQTAGKGQRGNTWISEPGMNLTFSVIVKPSFLTVKNQFFLNIITSLAVRDFLLKKTDVGISIKWPNDILVPSKKICGILIESQVQGQQLANVVIGIGLNINQQNFPLGTATSLSCFTNKTYDLPSMLHELLELLEVRYLQLRQQKFVELKKEYLAALHWRDEEHTFSSNNISFQGIIRGIHEDGRLQMETDEGIKAFDVKTLTYIR